jgi:hypothetical protein
MHWKRRKCANHNKFAPLVPVKHSAHVKNIAPSVRLKKRQANLGVSPFFHSALLQFDTEKRGATTPAARLSCSPATPSNSTDLFVGIDTRMVRRGGRRQQDGKRRSRRQHAARGPLPPSSFLSRTAGLMGRQARAPRRSASLRCGAPSCPQTNC